MKYIIFFILLFSLIYLNYNIKESFSGHTTSSNYSYKTCPEGENLFIPPICGNDDNCNSDDCELKNYSYCSQSSNWETDAQCFDNNTKTDCEGQADCSWKSSDICTYSGNPECRKDCYEYNTNEAQCKSEKHCVFNVDQGYDQCSPCEYLQNYDCDNTEGKCTWDEKSNICLPTKSGTTSTSSVATSSVATSSVATSSVATSSAATSSDANNGVKTEPAKRDYTNIREIDNKFVEFVNIQPNQNLVPYSELKTSSICQFNSDCAPDICGSQLKESGDCEGCDPNKCYKIIDKKMFELTQAEKSYIKVNDIDSLNMNFKFSVIASSDNNNQIIVQSGLNLWYIVINDYKFKLYIKNISDNGRELKLSSSNNKLTVNNDIYNFTVMVNNDSIMIDINGNETRVEFYSDGISIYDCNSGVCSDGGYCSNTFNERKCVYNKSHPLYFGGTDSMKSKFFNGYIGGLSFYDENNKMCTFKSNKDGIRSDCSIKCLKDKDCNPNECEEVCRDIPVCKFDSSKNISRHAIDCMTKCINPETDCDVNYCKKQCWECGTDCYWIKQNKFSALDGTAGTPYPPKISLHSTSYDGTKATISWEPPIEGDDAIDGYFSLTYNTKHPNNGLKIDKINTGLCGKYCEYVISDLIPEEEYTVVVKAYNSIGIGRPSNKLQFKTVKKLINTEVLNKIEDVSQYQVGNYSNNNFCNI
jgi:hypothetical protein